MSYEAGIGGGALMALFAIASLGCALVIIAALRGAWADRRDKGTSTDRISPRDRETPVRARRIERGADLWALKRIGKAIRVAPTRAILGLLLLSPSLFLSLFFLFAFGGTLLDAVLVFFKYGLSGLAEHPEHHIIQSDANYVAGLCLKAFGIVIPVGGMGLKLFLLVLYIAVGGMLLLSAEERADAIRADSAKND